MRNSYCNPLLLFRCSFCKLYSTTRGLKRSHLFINSLVTLFIHSINVSSFLGGQMISYLSLCISNF
jgi:hypothetical protein